MIAGHEHITTVGHAVVTGANSGIGRAAAIQLAVQGFTVYGTVRNADKAERLGVMAARRCACEPCRTRCRRGRIGRTGFADILKETMA